ncbi:MAG: uracil-DNA glycosylase [Anaeromyxobacter sp.]
MSKGTQRLTPELAAVAAEAARHLGWLASAGVEEIPDPSSIQVPAPPPPAPPPAGPAPTSAQPVGGPRTDPARPPPTRAVAEGTHPAAPTPTRAPTPSTAPAPLARGGAAPGPYALTDKGCGSPALLELRAGLGECQRCKLGATRTKLVFGTGNPQAELMFVGEGPGADEDAQGEPFVGKAGQLLTKMIEAMGYARGDVYIANVVKCRPPGNRNPEPDEIEACEPYLRAQIDAIRPKIIVALGKFAAQTLLRETTPITKLRGRWSSYEGVKLMPTFHPAYLLRSPEEKKKAWEDLQLVMKELGKSPRRPA